MRVVTEIHGDTAIIHPVTGDERGVLASKLLAAAGDRRREVRTYTGRTGAGFRVPLDIAEAAGLTGPAEAPAEEPVKAARKPRAKAKAAEPEVSA